LRRSKEYRREELKVKSQDQEQWRTILEEAKVHQGTKYKKKKKKEEEEEEEEEEESTAKVVAVITAWSERKIHTLCVHVYVHTCVGLPLL